MLNQCIFVGKITHITSYDKELLRVVLRIETSDKNSDKVTIDIPSEMASYEHFMEGNTIAVKARVASSNATSYRFIVERITFLGGSSNGS